MMDSSVERNMRRKLSGKEGREWKGKRRQNNEGKRRGKTMKYEEEGRVRG